MELVLGKSSKSPLASAAKQRKTEAWPVPMEPYSLQADPLALRRMYPALPSTPNKVECLSPRFRPLKLAHPLWPGALPSCRSLGSPPSAWLPIFS